MLLKDLLEGDLELKLLTGEDMDLGVSVKGCYTSDLLSQVLAKGRGLSLWVTIQNHLNIVGVASMLDLKAIIICEGRGAPDEVIAKAEEEGIVILSYPKGAYEIGGRLFERGL